MREMTLTAGELADIALAPAPAHQPLFDQGAIFLGTVTGANLGEVYDLWVVEADPPTILVRTDDDLKNDQHQFACPHCEKAVGYRGIPRSWSQKAPDLAAAMMQAEHRAAVILRVISTNKDVAEKITLTLERNLAVAKVDADHGHKVGHDSRTGHSVTLVPKRHTAVAPDGTPLDGDASPDF